MPAHTLEQVKQREQALRESVAGLGESAEPAQRRALRKKLRRAQRKRRRLATEAERQTAKASKAKAEKTPETQPAEKPAEGSEAPEQQASEE